MSLQPTKKTGKTRVVSTAREVLEELALVHELPALVLRWREIQKLKGTYVDALPGWSIRRTGRVHTTFNQAVAATGRLSSSDPNLQNIPIRTRARPRDPRGVRRRAGSSSHLGRLLADRAARARAPVGRRGARPRRFSEGIDIHDRTAERVFGGLDGPLELDAHELRRRAKIINYALLYGKTAFTLAKDIGVTADGRAGVHRRVLRRLSRPSARSSTARSRRPARRESSARSAAAGGWCPSWRARTGRSAPRPSARR